MSKSRSFFYYPEHFRINQLTELDKNRIHNVLNNIQPTEAPIYKKTNHRRSTVVQLFKGLITQIGLVSREKR